MKERSIANITVMVTGYDEAITYYREKLGFTLVEDTPIGDEKRFVRMSPGNSGPCILLATADSGAQQRYVGDQTGGRVFLFLHTDDFWRDFEKLREGGVELTEEPRHEEYGTVVVFRDLYGNLWDLVQPPAEISGNDQQNMPGLPVLSLMLGRYSIHRLAAGSSIPAIALEGEFFSVTRTIDELSIVCEQSAAIESEHCEADWCCIKVVGPLEFSMTGVLAKLSKVLADASVSIFAISTFDTDYIMVKSDNIDKAKGELMNAGYIFDNQ